MVLRTVLFIRGIIVLLVNSKIIIIIHFCIFVLEILFDKAPEIIKKARNKNLLGVKVLAFFRKSFMVVFFV